MLTLDDSSSSIISRRLRLLRYDATFSFTLTITFAAFCIWQAIINNRVTSIDILSAVLTKLRPRQHGQSSYTLRLKLGRIL